MAYLNISDTARLALHNSLGTLAWSLSGAFSAALLLGAGFLPWQIFAAFAAILALRFVLRLLVLYLAPALGLRRMFIIGAFLSALACPALAMVNRGGLGLLLFIGIAAVGQVFYCTCYHVFFAALSENGRRGRQVGLFQALGTFAAVVGPAAGGLLLAARGPWLTLAVAFLIALVAILPLIGIADPPIPQTSPRGAYAASMTGIKLFFADGWMQVSLSTAWGIILFEALHDRYDSFGATLSLATLTGALGGILVGRLIDRGHGTSTVWINACLLAAIVVLRSVTFGNSATALAVAISTTLLGGFYLPYWMTAAYNEARRAPCAFRFQFGAEGGWDAGGVSAGLIAAMLCALGLAVDAVILLALPMVIAQAMLLADVYGQQTRAGKEARMVATAGTIGS